MANESQERSPDRLTPLMKSVGAAHLMSATARVQSAGTAQVIARSLLVAAYEKRYQALLPPDSRALSERLLRAAGQAWFVRAAASRVFRAVCRASLGFMIPGIILHYLARKRCLEDWLRGACGSGGCRQAVILGAGLDTLGWRMQRELPAINFIELDRPAALRVKAAAMTAQGSWRPNLAFLAADLGRETLADALKRCPLFDPDASTFFLAEGLLMYLPLERVRSLLGEIAVLGKPGTSPVVAFTFMEQRPDGSIGFRVSSSFVKWWMDRQGEPFRSSCAPDELAAMLAPIGFRLSELVSGDNLRSRYLDPAGLPAAPLAMGEWLALAQADTHT